MVMVNGSFLGCGSRNKVDIKMTFELLVHYPVV